MKDTRAYVTGVVDQVAAAKNGDKTTITQIIDKVAKEHPAAAEELARGVVEHGLHGIAARNREQRDR